jgi:hypothetical protein
MTERAWIGSWMVAAVGMAAVGMAACQPPPEDGFSGPVEETMGALTAAAAPALTLQNRDGAPFPNRLVTSSLQGDTTNQIVHDHATLRVTNSGTAPLTISGLPVAGPFALSPKPTLPLAVAAGAFTDLTVAFTATTLGKVQTGTLTIQSDVPGATSVPVALAGSRTKPEGGNEPSLVQVISLFGYKTVILGSGQTINEHGLIHAVGDEVLSVFWKPADPTKTVRVLQLCAYHTRGGTGPIAWHAKGSTTLHTIVTSGGNSAQSVLPRKNGSTTAAATGSFTPGGVFGLKVSGEWSDNTRNNVTKDMQNGCPGPCGHHVRFWPAKDAAGQVIPASFLVAMDSASGNYDYNDDVYIISNIAPE